MKKVLIGQSFRRQSFFALYSYFESQLYRVLDSVPPSFRKVIFKLILRRIARGSWIDYTTYIRYPWRVSIGANSAINRGCKFFPSIATGLGTIEIGDNVLVGPDVMFLAAGHDIKTFSYNDVSGPIRVEHNVFIGAGSIIRYGVVIGEGSVVAAGSVVVKDVEQFSIVAGSPAVVIGLRTIEKNVRNGLD